VSDCIDHGYLGNGKGYVKINGKFLHRTVLEHKLGRPIERGMVAMHACNNTRCINEAHLNEGTQRKNIQDAFRDGLHPIGSAKSTSKLTEDMVRILRDRYVPRCRINGTRALAREFNVSQWVISHTIRGIETWSHV